MESTSITLTRYLLMQQREHPGATGEFSMLLSQIAFAAKTISRELGRAGLVEVFNGILDIVQADAVDDDTEIAFA